MVKFLSISPAEYKLSCSKINIIYGQHKTPFGDCLIGVKIPENAVCYLHFINKKIGKDFDDLKNQWPNVQLIKDQKKTKDIVDKIFSIDHNDICVYLMGTEFQVKVWKSLTTIPKGETVNYDFIAKAVNSPRAIQAISKIIGSNRVCVVIPCHRTVSKSSKLSATCWRTDKRPLLLEYERKQLEE